MDFNVHCVVVWVMLGSLVVFQFFFGVKYFSTFSTHILPCSGIWGAIALDNLTQFFTSLFRRRKKALKLMCADNPRHTFCRLSAI
jgi:hypothetical protein